MMHDEEEKRALTKSRKNGGASSIFMGFRIAVAILRGLTKKGCGVFSTEQEFHVAHHLNSSTIKIGRRQQNPIFQQVRKNISIENYIFE